MDGLDPDSLEAIATRLLDREREAAGGHFSTAPVADGAIAELLCRALAMRASLAGVDLRYGSIGRALSGAGPATPIRADFATAFARSLAYVGRSYIVPESLGAAAEAWPDRSMARPFMADHPRFFTAREISQISGAAASPPAAWTPLCGREGRRRFRDWAIGSCRVLDSYRILPGTLYYYGDRMYFRLTAERSEQGEDYDPAHLWQFSSIPWRRSGDRPLDEDPVPFVERRGPYEVPAVEAVIRQRESFEGGNAAFSALEQSFALDPARPEPRVINSAPLPGRLSLWSFTGALRRRALTAHVWNGYASEHGGASSESVEVTLVEEQGDASEAVGGAIPWHLVDRLVRRRWEVSGSDSDDVDVRTFDHTVWCRSPATGRYAEVYHRSGADALFDPQWGALRGWYNFYLDLDLFDTFPAPGSHVPDLAQAYVDPNVVAPGDMRDLYPHLQDPRTRDEDVTPTAERPTPYLPAAASSALQGYIPAFDPNDWLVHLPGVPAEPKFREITARCSLLRYPTFDYADSLLAQQRKISRDLGLADEEDQTTNQ